MGVDVMDTCADVVDYVDVGGRSCMFWAGAVGQCHKAAQVYGYSAADEAAVLIGCRRSCGMCEYSGGPTVDVPTTGGGGRTIESGTDTWQVVALVGLAVAFMATMATVVTHCRSRGRHESRLVGRITSFQPAAFIKAHRERRGAQQSALQCDRTEPDPFDSSVYSIAAAHKLPPPDRLNAAAAERRAWRAPFAARLRTDGSGTVNFDEGPTYSVADASSHAPESVTYSTASAAVQPRPLNIGMRLGTARHGQGAAVAGRLPAFQGGAGDTYDIRTINYGSAAGSHRATAEPVYTVAQAAPGAQAAGAARFDRSARQTRKILQRAVLAVDEIYDDSDQIGRMMLDGVEPEYKQPQRSQQRPAADYDISTLPQAKDDEGHVLL